MTFINLQNVLVSATMVLLKIGIYEYQVVLNLISSQGSLSDALSDEKPTSDFRSDESVDPGLPYAQLSPSEGQSSLDKAGGLTKGGGNLRRGGGHQLNLAVFHESGPGWAKGL